MIRLLGHGKPTPRPSGRRRISNQLAAFAAIMLFASTQVPSPDTMDTGRAPDPATVVAAPESSDAGGPASAVSAQADSGNQRKSRSLNLSLFLLGR